VSFRGPMTLTMCKRKLKGVEGLLGCRFCSTSLRAGGDFCDGNLLEVWQKLQCTMGFTIVIINMSDRNTNKHCYCKMKTKVPSVHY
jgi:hypothetical protein